jgi:hypothetical protein
MRTEIKYFVHRSALELATAGFDGGNEERGERFIDEERAAVL